jgi:hypothetical protein
MGREEEGGQGGGGGQEAESEQGDCGAWLELDEDLDRVRQMGVGGENDDGFYHDICCVSSVPLDGDVSDCVPDMWSAVWI